MTPAAQAFVGESATTDWSWDTPAGKATGVLQAWPFQCSISVRSPPAPLPGFVAVLLKLPTAQTSELEVAPTLWMWFLVAPGLGLETTTASTASSSAGNK